MDIDVMQWLRASRAPRLVEQTDALPGRRTPVLDPIPTHEVLGLPLDAEPEGSDVAYVAMGCYWGAEKVFWNTPGVLNTAVGFMGGFTPNPTYDESCTGLTGHTETVKVVFDPEQITYDEVLRVFFEHHDPTTANRQGNDVGTQYRSAIFPVDDDQLARAVAIRDAYQDELTKAGFGEISTEITQGMGFYFAEVEHQQYLHKNPHGYDCHVRTGIACPLP